MFVCGQWMGGEGEVINSADKSECVCWQSVHPATPPQKKKLTTSRILHHS